MGGQPPRALRLTPGGARAVRAWADGREVSAAQLPLARRLHDAGLGVLADPAPGLTPDDVTVVVPVRDRPEQLRRCLDALRGCRVLVVDDASAVPVPGALRLPVRRGPAGARNAGLAAVRTPLVAFVDSDCVVPPGWLEDLLPHLLDGVAVVAPRVVGAGGPGPLARFEVRNGPLDLGPDPAPVRPGGRVGHLPAAVLLARVEALGSGFEEALHVGEDVDLVWRLAAGGASVRYVPDVVVRHETRPALGPWLRQRYGYGASAALLDVRHPGKVAPAVLPLRLLPAALLAPVAPRSALVAAVCGTAVSARAVRRQLPVGPGRDAEALRLAAEGTVGSGRSLALAAARPWSPLLLPLLLVPARGRAARRARALLLAALLLRVPGRARLADPVSVPLAVLDDLAYGAGVWAGALRYRRSRVLLPRRR